MDKPAYRSMSAVGRGVVRPALEWILLFILYGRERILIHFLISLFCEEFSENAIAAVLTSCGNPTVRP